MENRNENGDNFFESILDKTSATHNHLLLTRIKNKKHLTFRERNSLADYREIGEETIGRHYTRKGDYFIRKGFKWWGELPKKIEAAKWDLYLKLTDLSPEPELERDKYPKTAIALPTPSLTPSLKLA